MSLEKNLLSRSGGKCEISGETENLKVFAVLPSRTNDLQDHVLLNQNLIDQIENPETMDENSWRSLSDSMWSEHLPVQIISWRILSCLQKHELLDQMYLEEDDLNWAKATGEGEDDENKIIHKDCNGVTLQTGDSVVLIKDLKVKGSSMIAKQGTAVRNIRLDHENAEYIEGKVDGQQIVIITQYVKKV
ncbi:PhnA protein [Flavobacterium sp. NST-5]|uniref:PhnA protein n=1 Tax=Flavobacterium ichthyis TaxID=2698827 RepID=A0ABW9Z999_9FLAO|nr:alkylphosphonate utilization protein [Flavobacterium ichthyis]NBL65296.1 PhnA protein [Flavobacterium ichthyis]